MEITNTLGRLSKWFWNPDFWLPVNFTWEDIQPRENFKYPDNRDILIYPLLFALIFLIFRYYVSDVYLFSPIVRYYRLNTKKPTPPEENAELELLFSKFKKKIPRLRIERVAEKLNWKTADVIRWVRQRRAVTRLTLGEKFQDTGFMLIAHALHFFLGVYVLWEKKWVWDISHCWHMYPHHQIEDDVWFYYMYGFGFYLSLVIHQSLQPSRKDDVANFLHHGFTLTLFWFSWTMNFIRVGTLVLLIHQFADWILLIAKLFNYLKKETLTDIFFGVTIVVWIATRLVIYPIWIIRSAFFEGPTYMFMPSAYLFFALLLGLLVLNTMWLILMIVIVIKKLQSGKLEDLRSSDEFSDDEVEKNKNL